LAAIGEADRVDLRAVAVETAHQKIDGGLGEGDVVDIGAPRRGGVDEPGVVPVPFVSVQVGNNGPDCAPTWSNVFAVNERIAAAVCVEP
jgi:hypothetical protein